MIIADDIPTHRYSIPLRWADKIRIERIGDELAIEGWRLQKEVDLLAASEQNEQSPHLEFANCRDDTQLIQFVESFGPVVASLVLNPELPENIFGPLMEELGSRHWDCEYDYYRELERRLKSRPVEARGAIQSMVELRREQTLFRSAVELMQLLLEPEAVADNNKSAELAAPEISLLGRITVLVDLIVEGTRSWTTQLKREKRQILELQGRLFPGWLWTQEMQTEIEGWAIRIHLELAEAKKHPATDNRSKWSYEGLSEATSVAKNIITALLNAFPTTLWWHADIIEAPPSELRHGIRPLLFAMLRRDLTTGRVVQMCKRPSCGNFFVANRGDKKCCSKRCSMNEAAKKYYAQTVKPTRKKKGTEKKHVQVNNNEIH